VHHTVRRARRSRALCLLCFWTAMAAALAAGAWPSVRQHPAFRVGTIRLVGCPDALRTDAARILQPLLGRDLFAVRGQSPAFTAKLRALPEVAAAELVCRLPRTVVASFKTRQPVLCALAGERWLLVDAEGRVLRQVAQSPAGLPQAYGLCAGAEQPGEHVPAEPLAAIRDVIDVARECLGAAPRGVSLGEAGALRLRTGDGDVVILGPADRLAEKLHVYRAVRARLDHPVAYIDVTVPSAPVWREGPS
jgi:cell division septal protein FtsQ